eukprot:TRINITY_DN2352_c0_g1::TRINITY_DN2352_c0_g1_i1::g.20932::m.20932 TRINITY_DN2352_c0_g1::TRINITY_DN2352_c0_g1_i1::g.20932  ORF type:complete len:226 (-),score=61.79,sp/Q8GYG1/P24D7_ARATH/29.30/6e-24,EMP24_GP25L/PF01105.19/1.3e-40,DASH_Dam1/PF08653.5/0.18,Cauli_AT/PF03233.8/0.18 TRINITY_DN2352_c0_g1_i1:551-1189(-)
MAYLRIEAVLVGLLFLIQSIYCLKIQLPLDGGSKCFKEDVEAHELIVVDYNIIIQAENPAATRVNIKAHGQDKVFYDKTAEAGKGKFAFSSLDDGEYFVCFTTSSGDWRENDALFIDVAIDARYEEDDYSDAAKAEALTRVQNRVNHLEEAMGHITDEMKLMRGREEEMRQLNETINAALITVSVGSILFVVAVNAWQFYYLKRYFVQKKII